MTATLTRDRLIERATITGRVNEAAGVIHDVRILGQKSRNKRRYSEAALRGAVRDGLYEGVKVFVDHPEHDGDRSFRTWAGTVRNVRYREGALYGDIHLRKKSEHYDSIIEAAQSFSSHFGLSHVATGEMGLGHDGVEVVKEITAVYSVDIVTEPATNSGLFESTQSELIEELNRRIEYAEARGALLEATLPGNGRRDWVRESFATVLSESELFAAAAGSERMLAEGIRRKFEQAEQSAATRVRRYF